MASPGFERNHRLCGFLRFVVGGKLQGKTGELKESVIGTEVFGRKPGYDTHSDPVVRTEASKLRARLGEYYAGPGVHDVVRIEIPKGAYIPQWKVSGAATGRRWRWAAAAAVTLGLVIAGVAVWRATRTSARPTIAVLPFLNLSSDPDNEYFSIGLADEITGLLALTEGLEVTARTSSFALKGTQLSAREIGERLNATVLVEGSVQRSPDRLKVSVQLIRAADGKHIWSNTYQREMRDMFATQEESAASIANALRLKLGAWRRYTDNLVDILSLQSEVARSIVTEIRTQLIRADQARFARARRVNPEAYLAVLKGRYSWLVEREASDRKSLDYFNQAIDLDPNYAEAYAGRALAWNSLYYGGAEPAAEALTKAREAAEKAVALDDSLPEAHEALGFVMASEWNYAGAEREYRRALDLNPSYAEAHQFYADLLRHLGRHEEAIAQAKRTLELDPLSMGANESPADAYLNARQYDRAIEQYRKALELHPEHPNLHYHLGWVYVYKGMYEKGIEEIQRSLKLEDADPDLSADLAYIYGVMGRREEARKILDQLMRFSKQTPVAPEYFAFIYIGLGDKESAFAWLEKAYQQHSPTMAWLKVDPRFDSLRMDPRFTDLMRRVGLLEAR